MPQDIFMSGIRLFAGYHLILHVQDHKGKMKLEDGLGIAKIQASHLHDPVDAVL